MRSTAKIRSLLVCTAVFAAVAWALPAPAQEDLGVRRLGIRGGVTVDPDQGHVGFHVDAGQLAENLRFQPSFELGFGDDLVVGTINVDALYQFRPRPWTPYLGAGLGVALIDVDDAFRGRRDDGLEVEAGLNLVAGIEWGPQHKYLLELRGGVGDIPDLKLTIGINF